MNLRRWPWPVWIVGLVLVTNTIVLSAVWWNRMEPAEATLMLTGRDVDVMNVIRNAAPIDASRRLPLQLVVRYANTQYRPPGSQATWFSAARLRANGIEVPASAPPYGGADVVRRSHPTVPVYAVLEHTGLAFQDEYHRQCEEPVSHPNEPAVAAGQGSPRCEQVRDGSRLYIMDIGSSRLQLRDRYPDRNRYAVMRASLRLPTNQDEWAPVGSVQLLQPMIATDDPWRSHLPELLRQPGDSMHLSVAFGRSLEPWLIAFTSDSAR